MIHLDRNLHSSPQNIDHHKILSWSSLSHDDQSFNPDDFLSDALTAVDHHIDPLSIPNGPILSHTSSPADGNSTSPTRDRSSSLSPAPETGSNIGSPPLPPAAEEKEAPAVIPRREEEEEEDGDDEMQASHPSRQSTPLSELSPPPDQDDEPDVPEPEGGTGSESVTKEGGGQKEPKTDVMKVKSSDHHASFASSPRASTDAVTSESKPSYDSNLAKTTNLMPLSSAPSIDSPAPPLFPTSPTQKSDPKVVSILDLNSELLKICIDFQTRGFAGSDMKFQQYVCLPFL